MSPKNEKKNKAPAAPAIYIKLCYKALAYVF